MKKITKYHKRVRITFVIAALACCFLLLFFFDSGMSKPGTVGYYVVKVGDEVVGTVNNREKAERALSAARTMLSEKADSVVYLNTDLELEEEKHLYADTLSEQQLTESFYDYLEQQVNLDLTRGYMIAAGEYSIVVDSVDSVAAVLETLESSYDSESKYSVCLASINDGNFTGITYDIAKSGESTKLAGAEEQITSGSESGETADAADTASGTEAQAAAQTAEAGTDVANIAAAQPGEAVPAGGEKQSDAGTQPSADVAEAQAAADVAEAASGAEAQPVVEASEAQAAAASEEALAADPQAADAAVLGSGEVPAEDGGINTLEENPVNQVMASGDETAENVSKSNLEVVGFSEDLEIRQVYVDSSEILTAEEAIKELGEAGAAAIGVETVEVQNYDESYYDEEQIIEDDTLYIGQNVTLQEPVPGIRNITARVTYLNGFETKRDILDENIIQPAVPAIIHTGTQEAPTFVPPVNGVITSTFGPRWGTVHQGIDYGVEYATPEVASRAGIVTYSGWNAGGYGNMVVIEHGDGLSTRYAHMCQVACAVGQHVEQYEVIGYAGSTGDSTGVHCHFEIMENGVPVDPFIYLNN